jgi:EF-P beta-lysylation protein EpmB
MSLHTSPKRERGNQFRPSLALRASGDSGELHDDRPGEEAWLAALRGAVRDVRELCRLVRLPDEFAAAAEAASRGFPLLVPRGYVARMQPGDPHDPLLRQVLPRPDETRQVPGFDADPVAEAPAAISPGVLRKYAGRILIVATPACAVHCRYCFRRHFPYADGPATAELWQHAVQAAERDPTVDEVLLSGGDPLSLRDPTLADLANRLAGIEHLKRLRIHTRLPVMIPQRVTDELIAWLTGTRLKPIVVVHANHPRELDAAVCHALGQLVDAGIPVLNQAVLLKGVNDDLDALTDLCRRLVDCRVMPYYLHQLDQVAGAAHFEVPVADGRRLVRELRRRLPGYAVPRYVQEVPGEPHKRVLE